MSLWDKYIYFGHRRRYKAQIKGLENLFTEITIEKFPILQAMLDNQVQEVFRIPNRHAQKFTLN